MCARGGGLGESVFSNENRVLSWFRVRQRDRWKDRQEEKKEEEIRERENGDERGPKR